jgi:hypothetical protein
MEKKDIALIDFLPHTQISYDGRLWRNGKEKKFTVSPIGYEVVSFSTNNKTKTYYKHRLMLHAFIGPCPDNCEALHINGNRLDNRLENLRWISSLQNSAVRKKAKMLKDGIELPKKREETLKIITTLESVFI